MAEAHFLCLAYPCSVDGGIDLVKFVKQLLRRRNDQLKNTVCQILEVGRGTSDANLLARAETLRQDWGSTVAQDKTNMQLDIQSALRFSVAANDPYRVYTQQTNELTRHFHCLVVSEFRTEYISSLGAFLLHYNHMFHRGIRFLYLIGHAISNNAADILHQHAADNETCKCEVWPWDMINSKDSAGINKNPSDVTNNAQRGDLVVFSCGLLTPEWVIDKLHKARTTYNNTIVIVVDSCYSGTWVERMKTKLRNTPLQHTRILLQTSCGPNEGACGQLFTPLFVNLNLGTNLSVNQQAPQQTPQFFDSDYLEEDHGAPPNIITIGGRLTYRFINYPIGTGSNAESRNRAFRVKVPYNS